MRTVMVVAAVLGLGYVAFDLATAGPPLLPQADKAAQAAAPNGDEAGLRKAIDTFAEAFNKGDLDGIMAHWAADADYTNEDGKSYRGTEAIAALFKQSLANLKGSKLRIRVASIRFIKPDVALEEGSVELTGPDGDAESNRYTAIWTKSGSRWVMASARDLPDNGPASADDASPLKELDWLVGEWTGEAGGGTVALSIRHAMNRKFLVQDFTVTPKNGDPLTVTQWVGWDPLAGQIRSWYFDSRGGHGGGYMARRGNTWTIAAQAVLPDGRVGTANNSFKHVDDQSFVWQSKDRSVDGLPVADSEAKFTRKLGGPAAK